MFVMSSLKFLGHSLAQINIKYVEFKETQIIHNVNKTFFIVAEMT